MLVKPVTRALADGGERTEVLLPAGCWFDLLSPVCYHGGRTISMSTPPDRFPVLVRAGSILPVAEGAQCAADLPVPAQEYLVFGGADGRTELYDDAGDGYEGGIRISIEYKDADARLLFGRVAGELREPVKMTIRLVRPDGVRVCRQAVYDGNELCVSLDESTEREEKPSETIQ